LYGLKNRDAGQTIFQETTAKHIGVDPSRVTHQTPFFDANEERRMIPGYKRILMALGILYVILAGSVLVQGIEKFMAPFGLPDSTLASPHYEDAMTWVYVHMTVLGMILFVVGWASRDLRFQRIFVRAMALAQGVYLFLDLRTSDTPLGNGLYKGPESAIPAIMGFCFFCLFVFLSFVPAKAVADQQDGGRT
jgi:hypothetical protein